MKMRCVKMAKKISSSSDPNTSSQAARRPVIQRANMSIFRCTPPAVPDGRQAAIATPNAIEVISFSPSTPRPASQRNSTSPTVTPAAISMPSTPTGASGRTLRSSHRSVWSRKCAGVGCAVSSANRPSLLFPSACVHAVDQKNNQHADQTSIGRNLAGLIPQYAAVSVSDKGVISNGDSRARYTRASRVVDAPQSPPSVPGTPQSYCDEGRPVKQFGAITAREGTDEDDALRIRCAGCSHARPASDRTAERSTGAADLCLAESGWNAQHCVLQQLGQPGLRAEQRKAQDRGARRRDAGELHHRL